MLNRLGSSRSSESLPFFPLFSLSDHSSVTHGQRQFPITYPGNFLPIKLALKHLTEDMKGHSIRLAVFTMSSFEFA